MWFLRHNLKLATEEGKLTAYLTFVRPVSEYTSAVWDPHKQKQIEKSEKVQRRAARFITAQHRKTQSVSAMITHLNLQSLAERRKVARLKFLNLIRKNGLNIDSLRYLKAHSSRELRKNHNEMIMLMKALIDPFKYSFFPRHAKKQLYFLNFQWHCQECHVPDTF